MRNIFFLEKLYEILDNKKENTPKRNADCHFYKKYLKIL